LRTGVPLGAVKSKTARAFKSLRRGLAPEDAAHSSPGRGDGLSRDGSKAFGVGTTRHPVDEDVISLGEDVQHL
jgi:hypothetical protein